MVYAFTQDVPIGPELYRRIVDELGPEPLEGSLLHLCVRTPEGGLRYIDIWESREHCARAFDERIHPAVDRAFGGSRPQGEPTVTRMEILDASGALVADRADLEVSAQGA
ncbi:MULTISPECIES: hypothetical protein [unclassified Pseudonocardia]|jgi:hypothetical protein|uniref:hypothetical protein n=1 Tax=unclassified Pseudonocardia TaxID=2619320 RepID=UPI000964B8A9|nr:MULTISPECIES: hypothetical protein [unclassified Pseudonocardia]MBN9101607.1 hypothetical protein [Pseudonocardia sp.]OJY44709.1 MAG: hypothetical protein BGP03_34435 [Pseudonocardia sp. 73-21]